MIYLTIGNKVKRTTIDTSGPCIIPCWSTSDFSHGCDGSGMEAKTCLVLAASLPLQWASEEPVSLEVAEELAAFGAALN